MSETSIIKVHLRILPGIILFSAFLYLIAYHGMSYDNGNKRYDNTKHSHHPIFVQQISRKQIAMVMFGVPKKFNLVWHSYYRRIVDFNHRHIDVYMHFYTDVETINTPRNGEINTPVSTFNEVLREFNRTNTTVKFITSSQTRFDKTLDDWIYQVKDVYKNNYTSIKNVFRQANSLALAFGEINQTLYDTYIFLRSDTYLMNFVDLSTSPRGIITPGWQTYNGVNDRIAIARPEEAKIYAARGFGYKKYMENGSNLNTEQLLQKWMRERGARSIVEDKFPYVIRLRANMRLSEDQKNILGLSPLDLNPIWGDKNQEKGYYELRELMQKGRLM